MKLFILLPIACQEFFTQPIKAKSQRNAFLIRVRGLVKEGMIEHHQ